MPYRFQGAEAESLDAVQTDRDPGGGVPPGSGSTRKWLNYEQAADYTGWSVRYLRNLVSADQIPVYGPLRSRRFRVDMLDLFLTNRDAAMRKFLAERSSHHGD
ncbi:MAG: helix-turn-helix domain-containing protein [Proteobacteria bacterium]|jgi:hypothetical protein|nr:helix-turn-helix domain-containing protein [Pseudomonadota bacterium]